MLAGKFFNIRSLAEMNGRVDALLEINALHEIFNGHFPGQPVVPGVCMVQMIKEVLELVLQKKSRLVNAGNIKFLNLVDPRASNSLRVELNYQATDDGSLKTTAGLLNGQVTCFRMNAVFVVE